MTAAPASTTTRTPLRLWPGVVAAVLLVLSRLVVPVLVPELAPFGVIGGLLCAIAVVVWWTFFSRAPRLERWGLIPLMIVGVVVTVRLVHVSIATGAMGGLLILYSFQVLGVALVIWAVASRGLSEGLRRATMVATVGVAFGVWTLLRTGGMTGDIVGSEFHWRWTPTAEERLLALAADEPRAATPAPAAIAPTTPSIPATVPAKEQPSAVVERAAPMAASPAAAPEVPPPPPVAKSPEWTGFRGAGRDSVVHGTRIATDWSASPPTELWRRLVGPGWSSFAVSGDLLYTQEQRGEDETVAAYRVTTGELVWRHGDPVRFWESNGGAGPRGTPTLSGGRVYTFGATGILNVLDAANGAVVWSRDVASDTDTPRPMWGFASSPLVVGDVVVVAASGTLAGYDLASGTRRWIGPAHVGDGNYSSPQLATIDGVTQVLMLSGAGATSLAPADGTLLWEYAWPGLGGAIVQPALTADGDILLNSIGMTGGAGLRRVAVTYGQGGWTVDQRWSSTGLKPYFSDFVVHEGHAYGFDGSILACIDLADGRRTWKGGRYGQGQAILLADQDLLLVLSEEGEVVLVSASPDQLTEIARLPALDGKTWNHPVLVGDVLLVRNGEEMAAFRLPTRVP